MNEIMSEKEINYWFETFKETKHAFMSKDGKKLSFYDVFKAMKELQNNWNELKKWLEDGFYWAYYEEDMSSGWVVEIMKEKMQELENKQCHTTLE